MSHQHNTNPSRRALLKQGAALAAGMGGLMVAGPSAAASSSDRSPFFIPLLCKCARRATRSW